jgi:hypothetical protein
MMSLWWGYLDDKGVVRIKRYTTDKAIWNCEQMPFCKGIFDPFPALNYEDAQRKIKQFLFEQQFYEKKDK